MLAVSGRIGVSGSTAELLFIADDVGPKCQLVGVVRWELEA